MNFDPATGLTIETEGTNVRRVVHVQGTLELPQAGSLRDVLIAELAPARRVTLDLAGVTNIDLCGLQLLCSAHRSYRAAGASFELQAIPDSVRQTVDRAGYDPRKSVCRFRDETCVWKG